jgi:hypothetical protein
MKTQSKDGVRLLSPRVGARTESFFFFFFGGLRRKPLGALACQQQFAEPVLGLEPQEDVWSLDAVRLLSPRVGARQGRFWGEPVVKSPEVRDGGGWGINKVCVSDDKPKTSNTGPRVVFFFFLRAPEDKHKERETDGFPT